MNRIVATLAVLATLAAAMATPPAHAADLPPATSAADCRTVAGTIENASFCQTSTDLAEVTLAPFAGAHAEAIYPGSFDLAIAGANAVLKYSWVYEGGTPGDLLHIGIDVKMGVSAFGSNDAFAFASVIVQTGAGGMVQACVYTNPGCAQGFTNFNGTIWITTRSGDVNTMEIQASASGTLSQDVNGGSAFADPHIFLDPQFPLSADYQLSLSDGVSNALAPIPEPATAALMAAGLAGVLIRRRVARAA